MSDSSTAASDLASQYTAQVTNDLERNIKEQERIGAEIAVLQEQLAALQKDHTVLVSVRQALGMTAEPGPAAPEPAAEAPLVPAPRKKNSERPAGGTRSKKARAAGSPGRRAKPARSATRKATAAPDQQPEQARQPSLIDLVRDHLGAQSEPRSAAEIATALDRAHPGRNIKTTVVRGTLETLVSKSQAQRTAQGRSIFYTAADGSGPAAAPKEQEQEQ
ncbi:hypothetical protein [Streptomyces broussonetiae]|uniref:Regulatory protein n=1 Tax=Streptomyces broussonetiae TaxID=2686304 RepID=A0ABV5EHZ7_9ACTN